MKTLIRPSEIYKAALLCLFFLFLVSCGGESKKSHRPADVDGFAKEMRSQFKRIRDAEGKVKDDEMRKMRKEAHLAMMHRYPVYYDWWLQDGKGIQWFDGSLSEQLARRLEAVRLSPTVDGTPEGVVQAFRFYVEAAEKRREERLKEFTKGAPKIIFTKFHTLRPSFFAYTEGLSDARAECNYYPGGQLALLKMNGIWAEEELLQADTSGVFRDPDLHFDGRHLLFSWKKSPKEDDFHLYEMDLSTRKTKTITSGLGHADIEAIYLPDENIMFNSTRSGSSVDCWYTEVSNLYLCDREGRYMRQIGFDQVHTLNPALLDDGRVVYTRWDYNDRGQVWTQPLFQMNIDGTGQTEYYGMNSWFPTTVTHVRQIPGTRKVMATVLGHHTPQHGKLGIIDPEAGRDENQGVMFVAPLRKPKAERIDSYGQFGDQFQHPFPLNENEYLVSYTPLGYHVGHPMQFGIYWMNADGERELLAADSTISCNEPLLVAPRERPFLKASTVDYTKDEGLYYVQNIYEGNSLDSISQGAVKKLRIVEIGFRAAGVGHVNGGGKGGGALSSSPVGVGNASWDLKKVHGTVDVYEDGSTFFSAPARVPLYFQALDENGFVIQTMRSWSTLQPGEFQSCVGCHEHKNTVPVSGHPVSIAMNKGVQRITPVDGGGIRNFSYMAEIQPIWDTHCISCHDGTKQKMSLKRDTVLDTHAKRFFARSYLNLTHAHNREGHEPWRGNPGHPEVNWINALSEPTRLAPYSAGAATSNLIKRLQKGHGGTNVSGEEIRTVAMWLDLLVPYVGDYREANNWTDEEKAFYDYYDEKREKAREEDRENVRRYVLSLAETKR